MTWLRETKSWLWLAAAAALLVLAVFVLGRCSQGDRLREERANTDKSEARTESAVEAVNEITKLGERGDATDEQVRQAQERIRQADASQRNRVARYELCVVQRGDDCERLLTAR